jgi:hypothetical protein
MSLFHQNIYRPDAHQLHACSLPKRMIDARVNAIHLFASLPCKGALEG